MLEATMHPDTLWVTLTYNNENLPLPPHVSKREIQKFLKKLRKQTPKFRYFIIGEYGDQTCRPHYHCCFFGLSPIYAHLIFKTWGKCDRGGFQVGELNQYTARYTAGYTTGKLTKQNLWKTQGYEPEFMLSSRQNGGIGYSAIVAIAEKWRKSKWRDDRVIRALRNGHMEQPLGRYLTKKLAELHEIPEEKFQGDYWLYQEEIFQKHKMGDPVDYYQQITSEDKIKAVAHEKRHNMWKPKRQF